MVNLQPLSWFLTSTLALEKLVNFINQRTTCTISKNPTRCNSMQIFIYCVATLHVSGVTASIIRNTKNCNRSLRYRSQHWYSYFPPTWPDLYQYYDLYRRLRLQFLVLLMMGAVTPETCRVAMQ